MKSFVLQNIESYVIYIFISVGGSTNTAKSLLWGTTKCCGLGCYEGIVFV